MMSKILKLIGGLVLASLMTACGGGGGSPGQTPGSGTPSGATATDLIFDLGGKSTITNSGSDLATLTVTVLDASRNVMPDVPVSVSLTDGVFQVVSGSTTDSNGRFVGTIGIGGNKSNRTINAQISAGGLSRVASVVVTGSQITVTPLPATPTPGQTVTLDIGTADSAGAPISTAVTLGGTAGVTGQYLTDAAGSRSITFIAPATVGVYTVVVSALGTSVVREIEVVSSTGSTRPAAVGPVNSATLTPVPNLVSVNQVGSTTQRSRLDARFIAPGNQPIENMRVRFELVAPVLGAGEFISSGNATVYSDASGIASANYVPGTRSSPTNGVQVRICYSLVDFTSSTDCPAAATANLTVAGSPLSITIGENNELAKGLGNISYIRKHLIQVADSSGAAVRDAVVSVSVDITHYGKGTAWGRAYAGFPLLRAPSRVDIHPDYVPNPLPPGTLQVTLQPSTSVPVTGTAGFNFWCLNEDFDRNGFIGAGEDINGSGAHEPRKADVVVAFPAGNKTDASGQLLVDVIYPQNVGRWLAYTLRATTAVEGSEGDFSKSYVTEVLEADVQNGSFLTPPFGVGSCRDRN